MAGKLKLVGDHFLEYYNTGYGQHSLLIDPAYEEREIIKAVGIPRSEAKHFRHAHYWNLIDDGARMEKVAFQTVKLEGDKLVTAGGRRSGLGSVILSRFFVSDTLSFPFEDSRIQKHV